VRKPPPIGHNGHAGGPDIPRHQGPVAAYFAGPSAVFDLGQDTTRPDASLAVQLYIPTGFALGGGGVYIAQQPSLMFMKDTSGDGKADEHRLHLTPPPPLR
jgi:hypothetical protein